MGAERGRTGEGGARWGLAREREPAGHALAGGPGLDLLRLALTAVRPGQQARPVQKKQVLCG
jgi:hypothetical protein